MQSTITYMPQPSPKDYSLAPNAPAVPSEWQQDQGMSVKEKVIYGLLGVAAIGGTIYFANKFIRGRIALNEENHTLTDGSSATVAKQIKMAFENDGWPGTDTTALRNSLRQIPSREEFDKVIKSYERLYSTATSKANLLKDMSDELQGSEYNEMLQIINGKPLKKGMPLPATVFESWAKRLKAAFDKMYGMFPGTDGDAIVAVFNEIPTHAAFIKVGVAYQKMYSRKLMEDLKSEAEFGQYMEWMKIITVKPSK